jgi:hypothetical protein
MSGAGGGGTPGAGGAGGGGTPGMSGAGGGGTPGNGSVVGIGICCVGAAGVAGAGAHTS